MSLTVTNALTVNGKGIATQVQTDWAQTDNTQATFIKNAPPITTSNGLTTLTGPLTVTGAVTAATAAISGAFSAGASTLAGTLFDGVSLIARNCNGTAPSMPTGTSIFTWNLTSGYGISSFINNAPNASTGGWEWLQYITGTKSITSMQLSRTGDLNIAGRLTSAGLTSTSTISAPGIVSTGNLQASGNIQASTAVTSAYYTWRAVQTAATAAVAASGAWAINLALFTVEQSGLFTGNVADPTASANTSMTMTFPYSGIYTIQWCANFNATATNQMWFFLYRSTKYTRTNERLAWQTVSGTNGRVTFTGYFQSNDCVGLGASSATTNNLIVNASYCNAYVNCTLIQRTV